MTELTGTLIEMNAHMVVTDDAMRSMVFGGAVVALFSMLMFVMLLDRKVANKAIRAGVYAFIQVIIARG